MLGPIRNDGWVRLGIGLLTAISCSAPALAQSERDDRVDSEFQIAAPSTWKRETFKLPPSFAPNMKFAGQEYLRFSPDMYNSTSDDFFSYVIAFRIDDHEPLNEQSLGSQLEVYYKGLARRVSKSQVDTENTSVNLLPPRADTKPFESTFRYELDWIEPFVTRESQQLMIEATHWKDTKKKRQWVFMQISSNKSLNAPIWKQMRKIQQDFFNSLQAHDK